jgi:hypothetical protein
MLSLAAFCHGTVLASYGKISIISQHFIYSSRNGRDMIPNCGLLMFHQLQGHFLYKLYSAKLVLISLALEHFHQGTTSQTCLKWAVALSEETLGGNESSLQLVSMIARMMTQLQGKRRTFRCANGFRHRRL